MPASPESILRSAFRGLRGQDARVTQRNRLLRVHVNGRLPADRVIIGAPESIDAKTPIRPDRDVAVFRGAMDNVRIHARPLDQAAVRALYDREKPTDAKADAHDV